MRNYPPDARIGHLFAIMHFMWNEYILCGIRCLMRFYQLYSICICKYFIFNVFCSINHLPAVKQVPYSPCYMPCASQSCSLKLNYMERICILPSDIVRLTGLSERQSQKIMRELKVSLRKSKSQFITKHELAAYMGINPDDIVLK